MKHSYFELISKPPPKVVFVDSNEENILNYPFLEIQICEEPFTIKEMIDTKFLALDEILKVN